MRVITVADKLYLGNQADSSH